MLTQKIEPSTEEHKISTQDLLDLERARPKTRNDCRGGIRPCPFISCKFNLYLDVRGNKEPFPNYPELLPDQIPHDSCVLDVVEEGDLVPLERIGKALNLTRERIRQLETRAVKKIRPLLNPE